MTWVAYTLSVLMFSGVCVLVLFALLRLQGYLPLNPAGVPSMPSLLALNTAVSFVTNTNWQAYSGESGVSYLDADGRPRLAELRLGGRRDGGGRGVRARADARRAPRDRQLLGRPDPVVPLRPAATVARLERGVRFAGRDRQLQRADAGQDRRRRIADHRPGSGRLAGGDQGARHQRRRLLQRQLGAPVREPHAAHESPADVRDPADSGRPRVHGREVRRGHSARMGVAGRDDDPVLDRRGDGLLVRAHRQSQPHQGRRDAGRDRRELRRQHGGQGGPLRHRADLGVRELDHSCLVRRCQLRVTTA